MTPQQETVSHFIRLIRGISGQYLRYACTHGACHRFYLILKDRFPSAVPYDLDGGHVVARIFDAYWDIYGEHNILKDGVPKKFTKKGLDQMSSCFFDEAYILNNTQHVQEHDAIKKKEGDQ